MQAEEYLIAKAMKLTNGNQTAAAGLLGLTRPTLNKRLKQERQCSPVARLAVSLIRQ